MQQSVGCARRINLEICIADGLTQNSRGGVRSREGMGLGRSGVWRRGLCRRRKCDKGNWLVPLGSDLSDAEKLAPSDWSCRELGSK
jgi:hypothetical protein